VETPCFVPDRRTQQALLAAVDHGVDVRILVPRTSDVPLAGWAANVVHARLLDAGIRIFECPPRMLHAKVVIVDGARATQGIANLDYRSLLQNCEPKLVSQDPDLCARLRVQFEDDLTEAAAVRATGWRCCGPVCTPHRLASASRCSCRSTGCHPVCSTWRRIPVSISRA